MSRNKQQGRYAGKRNGKHYRTRNTVGHRCFGWKLDNLPSEMAVFLEF